MGSTAIDFFFKFRIKEGKQGRYEQILKEGLAITTEKDPGVLIYDILKDSEGIYCQHERYENEDALKLHVQNTYAQLTEWMEITENIQTVALGKISDEFLKGFEAYNIEVFLPYARVTR